VRTLDPAPDSGQKEGTSSAATPMHCARCIVVRTRMRIDVAVVDAALIHRVQYGRHEEAHCRCQRTAGMKEAFGWKRIKLSSTGLAPAASRSSPRGRLPS